MIRVLNISSDRNIGGAGRCILNFLAHYDRTQFEVDVALPKGSLLISEVEKLDTRVIEVDGIGDKSLDFGAIRTLKGVIRNLNPNVVHTHGAMSGRIAARQCGKAIVYTRHSVFPVSKKLSRFPGKWINGKINEHYADAIIAVAEAAKENLVESGISPNRIEVILNGVEAQTRLSPEEIATEKARYSIPPDYFVAGILARMEPVKGHSYLLEAIRILKDQQTPITLIIAGVGSLEEELKQQANTLDLADSVLFPGFITDIPRLLSILDLQVNASYGTEATSLALLEGMSMGVPAVVTDYGGNPGVIANGQNGLLVPTRDSAALAEAIATLIDDKDIYARMSASCLDIFQEKFTADQYARNIETVYRRVAGKRG
ncbi:MAG: glycosyltransferase family 4 protein [Oscillospiraceae bacterium]|nr:glycosyltransferase family 4 protein [Oscillospiraceae bacterium]